MSDLSQSDRQKLQSSQTAVEKRLGIQRDYGPKPVHIRVAVAEVLKKCGVKQQEASD